MATRIARRTRRWSQRPSRSAAATAASILAVDPVTRCPALRPGGVPLPLAPEVRPDQVDDLIVAAAENRLDHEHAKPGHRTARRGAPGGLLEVAAADLVGGICAAMARAGTRLRWQSYSPLIRCR